MLSTDPNYNNKKKIMPEASSLEHETQRSYVPETFVYVALTIFFLNERSILNWGGKINQCGKV